jgi:hypothetical protein
MIAVEKHKKVMLTGLNLAFGALKPNLQITDDTCIALIKPSGAWAGPANLLLEIQKTYPDAELVSHTVFEHGQSTTYDAIKTTGENSRKFCSDFLDYQTSRESSQRSR